MTVLASFSLTLFLLMSWVLSHKFCLIHLLNIIFNRTLNSVYCVWNNCFFLQWGFFAGLMPDDFSDHPRWRFLGSILHPPSWLLWSCPRLIVYALLYTKQEKIHNEGQEIQLSSNKWCYIVSSLTHPSAQGLYHHVITKVVFPISFCFAEYEIQNPLTNFFDWVHCGFLLKLIYESSGLSPELICWLF